ncbi:hypothetical protein GCM10007989_06610 [Devosia pacifica]|uniref:Flagellar biosynthesis protein, FliO n=1 Tax=Devosia pacifica TaxID=1335967 RepID=A0A918RVX4_9HYPH|nr:flagellar biosynthetic protein FliO [Devosia pacifica]GHA14584.1 hypothetical protein GCM10007989_06610 [Devosia pacifica]
MQFLTSLFGGIGNTLITAGLALGIVLVLILFVLWLFKWITGRFGRGPQLRQRRLEIIESLPLDTKRRMLLVRRDDVEHLVITGGTTDVLVESRITPPRGQKPRQSGDAAASRFSNAATGADRDSGAPDTKNESKPGPTVSAFERMRDVSPTPRERAPSSLRHTGLLRPVTRREHSAHSSVSENSQRRSDDSAKQSQPTEPGTADFGIEDDARPETKNRFADLR